MPVHVAELVARSLPRTVSSVGGLESPEMTTVASEIAGTVVHLDIREGERVDAGHVVLRLDDAEARAGVSVTRARLTNARDRLARVERLFGQGVASQQQLDDARSGFDAASGAHREASTRLVKHTLRAPYAGELGLRQVDLGDYVRPGDPIVEISETTALELRFSVPQRHVGEVATGQMVHGIVGRCGSRFEGTVVAVDPRVDPRTRMVGIRAAVPNDARELHPGMAVRIRLLVAERPDAIVIPQEAVVRQGTKHLVYVIDEEGRAQPREVSLGEYFVDGVHVKAGLGAGQTVILAGQQKLRPGAAVKPVPHEAMQNPNVNVGNYGPLGCER
jgi:membrane fusion protein (multidrug efflux system)